MCLLIILRMMNIEQYRIRLLRSAKKVRNCSVLLKKHGRRFRVIISRDYANKQWSKEAVCILYIGLQAQARRTDAE